MTEEITTKRERKQVQNFKPEEAAPKKEIQFVQGSGITLADYPFFVKGLEKLKGDDDLVKLLHVVLFNAIGARLDTKKHIRHFSGFSAGFNKEEKITKLTENKKKWTVAQLKSAATLFGFERSGTRDDLILRLVDYLASPVALKEDEGHAHDTKKKSSSTKRKASEEEDEEEEDDEENNNGKKAKKASSKKAKKEPKKKASKTDANGNPKVKKTPTAFILFSTAHRDATKAANPDASFGDLGRLLGQEWKDLSDKSRAVRRERNRGRE